jgi:MGT family glycosyltransferase
MAKFLIATIPAVGHVNQAMPIARELVARGHEVWWYTSGSFQARVESTGSHFTPMRSGLDYSHPESLPPEWIKQRDALKGIDQLKFYIKHGFVDSAVGQVAELTAILQDFPADAILADLFCLGAIWIHERGGSPWAGLNISVLTSNSQDTAPFGLALKPDVSLFGQLRNRSLNWIAERVLFGEVTAYTNRVRANVGLAPAKSSFFNTISPFLHLAGSIPEFEYPRRDLPPQVHFVGALIDVIDSTKFTPPDWWDDLKMDLPVVHVTQGTIAADSEQLIAPTLRALAQENVLVVATVIGKQIESISPAAIPANSRIASFIPYTHLLPHVDLMITNGGFSGVQRALACGIPLISAGTTEDKAEMGARIEWTGVGIDLKTSTPTRSQIRSTVQKLLADRRYQQRAKDFQLEISQYDAPSIAATLLERLAATQQPVLRS